MKKVKMGFGEGGFQGFMARHVEKCVLVVVILLMAWFIYSGAGSSDVKITRDKLKQQAQDAETKISNSRWEEVAGERTPRTDVLTQMEMQKGKIDSRAYATAVWDGQLVPRLMPRLDPKIIAAENLVVTPYFGPLVLLGPEDEDAKAPPDPLKDLEIVIGDTGQGYPGEDEEEDEDEDKGKKRRSRRERDEKSSPMGSSPPGSSQPYGGGSSSKSKGKKGDDPYSSPSNQFSGNFGGAGSSRSISPEATLGVKAPAGSVVEPRYAMVITASVPFSKQWEAYREAFKDAPGGQDPERDVPNYTQIMVERLDVTADPAIDPATAPKESWESVSVAKLGAIEEKYGAVLNEIVDPEAVDEALTHPVPPFLLTDLRPVLLHPDIERASAVDMTFEAEEEAEFLETEDGFLMETEEDEDESGSGSFGGGSMNRGSGSMNRGGGSSRMSGGSSRMRGGRGGSAGFGSSGSYSPYGGSGGKNRMSGSGGGSFSGGSMNLETYRPVAKKLVRFVDFEAQPGHKYRYRVLLVLEDPNRPKDPDLEPEPTALDETVRERIKKLEAAEAKSGGSRRYRLVSEWSKPSAIAALPSPERFFAGETVPGATITIAGATIATTEPTAKVLAVKWDEKLGVFAPAEQTVHRASVLNATGDVEVIHPVLGDLRKVKDYELLTDGVVLDILGGEKLPGTADSKETIRAPGETLVMDASGNLVVTDEARDIEGYRKYIFPEPKKEEPKDKSKSEDSEGGSLGPMPGGGGSLGPAPGSGSSKGPPSQGYPTGKGSKKGRSR